MLPPVVKEFWNHGRRGLEFYFLYVTSRAPSQFVRHAIYRLMGLQLGSGSVIYGRVELRGLSGIAIGSGCAIGHDSILDGRGGLRIGNSVNLSTGVWIWTAEHDINSPTFAGIVAPVVLEDFVWLGGRVTVMPGITIGRGAVVASGAVVTRDVAPYAVVAGVPAKKIGERSQDLSYRLGPVGFFM